MEVPSATSCSEAATTADRDRPSLPTCPHTVARTELAVEVELKHPVERMVRAGQVVWTEVVEVVLWSGPPIRTVVCVDMQRWAWIALGYLFVVSAPIGMWALVAPQSFYDDFPGLGRVWVSVDGPYNEHLVRDVGALNLAVAALFVAAFVRLGRELVGIAGVVALVWGVPHAVYHLFNTEVLDVVDAVVSLLGLGVFAVLGGGLVYTSARLLPCGHEGRT